MHDAEGDVVAKSVQLLVAVALVLILLRIAVGDQAFLGHEAANSLSTLIATLLGVLTAFAIDRRREDRREMQLYGAELNAAVYDLASLRIACQHIRDQLVGGQATLDYLNKLSGIVALNQSPRFRREGSYLLKTSVAAILASIDATAPYIDSYRSAPFGKDRTVLTNSLDRLIKAINFTAERLLSSATALGFHSTVTDDERQEVQKFRNIIFGNSG
jgi:hypothetical protein